MTTKVNNHKISKMDRLYEDEGGYDFIGRSKTWYAITAVLVAASILAIAIRGFSLSLDFEGGTKLSMPAADLVAEQVGDTFEEAIGVEPEMVQIVGAGDSRTLEITVERLSQEQVDTARQAIFEQYHPKDAQGKATPDAIGSTTVSESWGSAITQRMLLAMAVFLVTATVYVAVRLQRDMAFAAILALILDGVIIAGIYAIFGLEVSPAVIIGLLTVLTFSIYDSVIVFDKVNENTEGFQGQRKKTYGELANLAVNQTVMRSISTSIISVLPIIALFVIAVWLMGIGTLRDLALIQLIGVIEGIFSSLFLATPLLVSIANRRKSVKKHNTEVRQFRAEHGEDADEDTVAAAALGSRKVTSLAAQDSEGEASSSDAALAPSTRNLNTPGSAGTSWRPGR